MGLPQLISPCAVAKVYHLLLALPRHTRKRQLLQDQRLARAVLNARDEEVILEGAAQDPIPGVVGSGLG
eukprot:6025527-Pyramimonas_sp.AAC.1